MIRHRHGVALVAVGVVGLLAIAVIGAPSVGYMLVVADADTGEEYLAASVDVGTVVALEYTHSVEKTPVRDVYVVRGTTLEMDRMEFHSYGAGLPAQAEISRSEDGAFVARPEGTYRQLGVVPGTTANHTLVVGDDRYDLVEISDSSPVVVTVRERGIVEKTTDMLRRNT